MTGPRSDDAIRTDLATEDGSEGRHAVDLAQCVCHAGQERSATGLMLCRFGGVHRRRGDTLWHHPGDEALVPISALVAAEARAEKAEAAVERLRSKTDEAAWLDGANLDHVSESLQALAAERDEARARVAAVEASLLQARTELRTWVSRDSAAIRMIGAAIAAAALPREDER